MIRTVEEYYDSLDILVHYGTPRRSGRYPWGSGDDEDGSQRNKSFLGHVKDLSNQGLSELEIATAMGMNTAQLRTAKAIAKNEKKQSDRLMALRLKEKGVSQSEIGRRLGIPEPSVRALLADSVKEKIDSLETTAAIIRNKVDQGAYIDVGTGVEHMLGVSDTKLRTAVAKLQDEGYTVEKVQVDQMWGTNKTTYKVVAPPGTTYVDIVKNKDNIQQVQAFSEDNGVSFLGIKDPLSVSSKRIGIMYDEDGGGNADGVIYVRPGVKDISMGNARYAQVRIAVDGTHYLKGMAVYKDDLPNGVDLMFNTNKSRKDSGDDKTAVMKSIKDDPDNPFGSVIRQKINAKTGKVESALNIVGGKDGAGEEGAWDDWSKNLPPQFLSKQAPQFAQQQLDLTYSRKKQDLDEINALTNPAVKKKLLEAYADGVDASAVHLKAAAMPRQATRVLLPINTLKDTEVYAPGFKNGERVVLVRFPHGGTFEIPELTVNNNHKPAKNLLGDVADAVGINSKVANRLSGADFDGDTVLVIPNNSNKIKSTSPLAALKDFDTRKAYPPYDGMKTIDGGNWDAAKKKVVYPEGKKSSPKGKGREMGDVSNLVTDMTIKGAPHSEIAKAVKHSMVVIDAEKHSLDYRKSALDNSIPTLKAKYQERKDGGASTLISRANGRIDVPLVKLRPARSGGPIDPITGKKVYTEPLAPYTDAKGNIKYRTMRSKKLAETDDAFTLVSSKGDIKIETIYATHSNRLKALANSARKSSLSTGTTPYSPSAKVAYAKEVASLNGKLTQAIKNRPLERQAQVYANTVYSAKKAANPDMDDDERKKVKYQALAAGRIRTQASKSQISLSDEEWEAIQAGAITNSKLNDILRYADVDRVKELATPRATTTMTSGTIARARSMVAAGRGRAEIAEALGVSVSTLSEALNG